jgi:hypothetical protein
MTPENPRQPAVRDDAEPRTHELHGGHEREAHKSRPKQSKTERRAGLRIGRNARRIIVCCTSDKTGAQRTPKPAKPAANADRGGMPRAVD